MSGDQFSRSAVSIEEMIDLKECRLTERYKFRLTMASM
jgi:hypothetical protein